jgi:hypothetical protein
MPVHPGAPPLLFRTYDPLVNSSEISSAFSSEIVHAEHGLRALGVAGC